MVNCKVKQGPLAFATFAIEVKQLRVRASTILSSTCLFISECQTSLNAVSLLPYLLVMLDCKLQRHQIICLHAYMEQAQLIVIATVQVCSIFDQ